jgi:hypothetical protein
MTRTIIVFNQPLTIQDGKCFEADGKEVLDLEAEQIALSDNDLKDELETLLWYDYQDNKN